MKGSLLIVSQSHAIMPLLTYNHPQSVSLAHRSCLSLDPNAKTALVLVAICTHIGGLLHLWIFLEDYSTWAHHETYM